jgi:hypothetical protein
VPNIKNLKAYTDELKELPDWRIGCIFTGKAHRREGVARAAVAGALEAIEKAGGGLVEDYPEQVAKRSPQRGAYFHTGPEELSADSVSDGTDESPSGAGSCADALDREVGGFEATTTAMARTLAPHSATGEPCAG